ncbi:MAG: hypothetical protein AABN95_26550 [Acidobacteriota bacterium]
MYCSSCGVAVAQGLSYCNYCGAKLGVANGDNLTTSSDVKPEKLIEMMGAVFVCGLIGTIVLMGVMKAVLHFDVPLIIAFTLLSFLIMLLLEGVFIRLLFRHKRGVEEAGPRKEHATKALEPAQARVLPEPVPSVTENTTRALEPVHNERASK